MLHFKLLLVLLALFMVEKQFQNLYVNILARERLILYGLYQFNVLCFSLLVFYVTDVKAEHIYNYY